MDDKMEDKMQQNMISNLPLLFANGYPTSLEKITETQLENFIPFMVQCSLGHINLPKKVDCSEPEWWPENVPFEIPLKKPKLYMGNWMERMKEIVVICYQFHKSLFLLRFCNDLAAYEHASLRFINNYNSTTSLFDRRNNKLLVTFRNENMSYDRQQKLRKTLLIQRNKNDSHDDDSQHMMVEPAPFDIYLCDNCDAELYSREAIMEHEQICNMEDDVILCDSPEPEIVATDCENENTELQNAFLFNFSLQSRSTDYNHPSKQIQKTHLIHSEELVTEKQTSRSRRLSRRNRTVNSFNRCSFIPISSPAGQQLLRSIKTPISVDYIYERQERLDRFCYTPLLLKTSFKHKIFEKKSSTGNVHCTFKRTQEQSAHIYTFPRRQFLQRRDTTQNFLFLNSPLIRKCRPIAVRLKKLNESSIAIEQTTPATTTAIATTTTITNSKINIRLTRDNSLNSNWRISPSTEVIVDTIDLCSSDDDDDDGDVDVDRPMINSSKHLQHLKQQQHQSQQILNNTAMLLERTSTITTRTTLIAAAAAAAAAASTTTSATATLDDINKTVAGRQLVTTTITNHHNNNNTTNTTSKKSEYTTSTLSTTTTTTTTTTHTNSNSNSTSSSSSTTSTSASATMEDNSLKPLQQSVYIFSNYKTNSVFNRCTVDTTIPSGHSAHSVVRAALNASSTYTTTESPRGQAKEYNQENCSLPKKLLTVSDWYAQHQHQHHNHHHPTSSEKKSNKSDNIHHFDNTISVVQPFNSTGRVISIDLTT